MSKSNSVDSFTFNNKLSNQTDTTNRPDYSSLSENLINGKNYEQSGCVHNYYNQQRNAESVNCSERRTSADSKSNHSLFCF